MKLRASFPLVVAIVALCTTAPGTIREIRRAVIGWKSGGPTRLSSERAMAAAHLTSGANLHIVVSPSPGAVSEERARWQEMVWLTMPTPPTRGTEFDSVPDTADFVLAPDGNGHIPDCCPPDRWRKVDSCHETARGLWVRIGRTPPLTVSRNQCLALLSPARELVGITPLFLLAGECLLVGGFFGLVAGLTSFSALMFLPPAFGFAPGPAFVFGTAGLVVAGCYFFGRACPRTRCRRRDANRTFDIAIAAALFVFLGFLSLSHPLLVPNGLAVVGGKAKLWLLGAGLPVGWFSDDSWSLLVPAYPPGAATLVLSCFAVCGGCGEWLTQLIGCAAMAFAFLAAVSSSCRGRTTRIAGTIWLLALFLHPVALKMGTQLYPDSMSTLCIVAGWNLLWIGTERRRRLAWISLGLAGWFKNEGLLFAVLIWLVWIIAGARQEQDQPCQTTGRHSVWREVVKSFPMLAIGLALPLSWQIGIHSSSGRLPGYAPLWKPDFHQMVVAFKLELQTILFRPWHDGLPFLAALLIFLLQHRVAKGRRQTKSRVGDCPTASTVEVFSAALFAICCLAVFPWIYGCSRAPDFEWHLLSSLTRLTWTPALVLTCASIRWFSDRMELTNPTEWTSPTRRWRPQKLFGRRLPSWSCSGSCPPPVAARTSSSSHRFPPCDPERRGPPREHRRAARS